MKEEHGRQQCELEEGKRIFIEQTQCTKNCCGDSTQLRTIQCIDIIICLRKVRKSSIGRRHHVPLLVRSTVWQQISFLILTQLITLKLQEVSRILPFNREGETDF